jgi:prefoldin subunit 5
MPISEEQVQAFQKSIDDLAKAIRDLRSILEVISTNLQHVSGAIGSSSGPGKQ